MELISNFKLVKRASILADEEGRYYVLRSLEFSRGNNSCTISLIQFNKHFTQIGMTIPTACDSEGFFISPNDKSFKYKFYLISILPEDLSKHICKHIKKKIPQAASA